MHGTQGQGCRSAGLSLFNIEASLLEDKTRHTAQIGQLEKQLNEARTTMEKYLRDYDTLYQRTQKLTEDLDEQMYNNSQLALETTGVENELKKKLEEINRVRQQKEKQERLVVAKVLLRREWKAVTSA